MIPKWQRRRYARGKRDALWLRVYFQNPWTLTRNILYMREEGEGEVEEMDEIDQINASS